MKWFWQRLNEPSTWNAIGTKGVIIAGVAQHVGSTMGAGAGLGVAVVGAILGAVMSEKGGQ